MDDIVKFLQSTAKTGEIITIAYGGGSNPGCARQLVVISCSDTDLRAYEEVTKQIKRYKIAKILWVKNSNDVTSDSFKKTIDNDDSAETSKFILPKLETLQQYAEYLKPALENAGWYIHQEDDLFGVGTLFKYGKHKKPPSIAIRYIDRSTDVIWNPEKNDFDIIKKDLTDRERPWRVDSWRFKEGRSFKLLYSAIKLFLEEVYASDPKQAKGMFAGH